MDGQHQEQFAYEAGGPRTRRHVASFAASIAAHAAIVGLIVCFAPPPSRTHSDWVLAYLVEVVDGDAGRGRAGAGASGAWSIQAHRGPLAAAKSVSVDQRKPAEATTRPARKPRPRIEEADREVASLAPVRSVAPQRPSDSGREEHVASRSGGGWTRSGDAGATPARSSDGTAAGGGNDAGGYGGAGAGGDPNSLGHADYARNPRPVYPAIARRRAQQGTVTLSVLVGADGSVERAEVADSSGFDALDDAALETVRSRWRFIPARHGGLAVESWVLVPIRFALIETNASR